MPAITRILRTAIDPGLVLTVTADVVSNGRVWLRGPLDSGEKSVYDVSANGTVTFGPYAVARGVDIEPLVGTLSYSFGVPKPVSLPDVVVKSPRLAGRRIGVIGDSKYKGNHDAVVNSSIANQARGPLIWANFLKPRFNFSVIYDDAAFTSVLNNRGFSGLNCCVSGDVTDGGIYQGVLTRIGQVIDKKPDIFVDNSGVNDITGGANAATIIANKTAIFSRALAEGKPLVASTIGNRPYATWAAGSVQRLTLMEVNEWIRRVATRSRGVSLFDEFKIVTDPATGQPRSGYLDPDGLHFSNQGGYYLGVEWNKLLDDLLGEGYENLHPGIDNVFDAVNNKRGNICPPISSGTAGSKANGITGNVMTGWKLQRSSGSGVITGVASVIADPDYGYLQQVDFTLPGSGGNEIFQFLPAVLPAASVAAGTWVRCGGFVRVPAQASFVQANDIQLRNNVNTAFSGYAMKTYDLTQFMPTVAYEGQPVTEPFQVPASPSTWLPYQQLRLDGTKVGSLTIKMAPTWLMPIDDPTLPGDAGLWG